MACCKCEEHQWRDRPKETYKNLDDGMEYCLFHAPADQKQMNGEPVTVKEFNERVFERIQGAIDSDHKMSFCDLSGTVFSGEIDFSGVTKEERQLPSISFNFATFIGQASFVSASFNGFARFSSTMFEERALFAFSTFSNGADFSSAMFKGRYAKFAHAKFTGETLFNSATFSTEAIFYAATFSGTADFESATFSKLANFPSATFSGSANFSETTFSDNGNFTSTTFSNRVNFNFARFSRFADFQFVTFSSSADFFGTSFSDYVMFRSTTFNGPAFFYKTVFTSVVFNRVACKRPLEFNNCRILSGGEMQFFFTDLYWFSFFSLDMTNISFLNSCWPVENGRYRIRAEDDEKPMWQVIRDFYQSMKRKYKDEHNEYEASRWHVAEKEAQLELLKQGHEPWFHWLVLWFYKQLSGFGEAPGRAIWVLLFFLFAPLVVLSLGEVFQHFVWWEFDKQSAMNVLDHWRYYVPLNKVPENEASWWTWLSQLLITAQFALFGMAVRNKFRR
ncbi:MAG: pentapeptide repeat-containing protein [Pseudodesulfovibrio sp.]